MNIELPKDAYGLEIPLNTEVLYDKHGVKFDVKNFRFYKAPSSQEGEWLVSGIFDDDTDEGFIMPKFLCITPPDSWEKLDEDLSNGMFGASPCCAYAGNESYSCDKCCFENARHCTRRVFTDIRNRICKLRGDDK